jgi:putative ABC transport system substrate-binding protein
MRIQSTKTNMLRKAALALTLVLSFCTISIALAADARPPARIARIGILSAASPALLAQFGILEPFFRGLRELGYIEGQNLVVEYRLAEGKLERLPELATDLVRLNVDVILASGPASARAAKNATSKIPVVFTLVGDAVAEGLVASLGRPEGNLTGVSISGGVEIVGKRMQLLKEAVPTVTRMGLLWNPGNPSHTSIVDKLPAIATSAGLELRLFEARRAEDFEQLFVSLKPEHIGALLVLEDVIFAIQARKLTEFLAQSRLPAIYGATEFVEAGGLMSYQTSFAAVNRQAATYVDKILKGARPSDLAVEEPTKFELVLNLKAAKALGIIIPQSLLLRADEVIQ